MLMSALYLKCHKNLQIKVDVKDLTVKHMC